MADPHVLELEGAQFRAVIDEVARRLADHLDHVAEQPVAIATERAAEVARELAGAALPEAGAPLAAVLDQLFDRVFPSPYHTGSPGFFGYFAGGGLPEAAIADLIAGVINRFVGRWSAAPAVTQLEANVVRWLAELIGFPAAARGVITSGGSLANLTAVFTARQRQLGFDLVGARIYASDQIHFSIPKAATICGLPPASVCRIASDGDGRIDVAALAAQVAADRARGLRPFLVVASAGTFLTGAVDDLAAVAEVARREHLWFHVDAAYGGFFQLTARGRALLRGIEHADSVTLDPHKGLFLPYGTGALLVRQGDVLKRAHEIDADFYGPLHDDADRIDFCSYSIEQSRPFRGLRVWLPLALHGIAPFRHNLDEKLDLAAFAGAALAEIPGLAVIAAPILTVLLFTAGDDARNQRLVERVNARGHAFLMTVQHHEAIVVRMCILSFRAHRDRVEVALADIRAVAAEL
ncbi:MAG TPA: aminotransferase class I/II-fold pyridoxal phosphate-dependent enzyme [Kofleriaceae bacterium]|nr:aminotransferase class I/II-fold pyridoxal phosphate-dependent enzyme [Kofleriaceae bacterium]